MFSAMHCLVFVHERGVLDTLIEKFRHLVLQVLILTFQAEVFLYDLIWVLLQANSDSFFFLIGTEDISSRDEIWCDTTEGRGIV